MRKIVFSTVFVLIGIMSSVAFAGEMEPANPPDSTNSYTLEDIYQRLNKGESGSQSTFSDPADGPTVPTGHTLNEVMEQAPAKDDTNGAKAGEVKIGKKFWGLNAASGEWGLQTGSRWLDNGNGTVTDRTTGLVWLKNANCTDALGSSSITGGKMSWDNAMIWSSLIKKGDCGLTAGSTVEGEWHLPTKSELAGITTGDEPVSSGAMQAFSGVQADFYWTSTSRSTNTAWAMGVYMPDGDVDLAPKTAECYVWPVRGGQ